jgi:arginine deiminase
MPPEEPSALMQEAFALHRSDHLQSRFNLQVTSETGVLRQVLVHTPGLEMELVSPENRLDLLFDDILYVSHARKEHLLMCALFEKIVGHSDAVLQIGPLLSEAFMLEEARHDFVELLCRIYQAANFQAFERELKQLSPEELHHFALTGASPLPLQSHPLPNLMFMRDVAAVVADHIILSHPATAARARESLIMRVVLHHHPAFAAYRDRIITLPPGVTFEGGDLLVASPEVVLIGHSERTSFGGVMAVAQELFDRTPVEHVLLVDLPKHRSCMHLDTVFTFATPDECVVFPPMVDRGDLGNVVHFTHSDTPSRFFSEVRPNLKRALEALLDRSLTFIPCGGDDPLSQRREQWTDGANFFALAPGVVLGYERNRQTFEMMRKHDYRVVTARGFLSYFQESDYVPDEKVAIKLEGTELSRGRGGPRCMTLPLARAPLDAFQQNGQASS